MHALTRSHAHLEKRNDARRVERRGGVVLCERSDQRLERARRRLRGSEPIFRRRAAAVELGEVAEQENRVACGRYAVVMQPLCSRYVAVIEPRSCSVT
jgi:hypothetical protein